MKNIFPRDYVVTFTRSSKLYILLCIGILLACLIAIVFSKINSNKYDKLENKI